MLAVDDVLSICVRLVVHFSFLWLDLWAGGEGELHRHFHGIREKSGEERRLFIV